MKLLKPRALANYAQVPDEHFERAINQVQKSGTKSGTVTAQKPAQRGTAGLVRGDEINPNPLPQTLVPFPFNALQDMSQLLTAQALAMEATGFEYPSNFPGKTHNMPRFGTKSGTLGMINREDLERIIAGALHICDSKLSSAWQNLDPAIRESITGILVHFLRSEDHIETN